jgi:ABC-type methionine transport system permease subunit
MIRQFSVPLLAGIVVMVALVLWRHFFWQHAAIIGLAVAALVYSARSTIQRLREMYKRN